MPLVARDGTGTRWIAPLLSGDEWEALSRQTLKADCCDSHMYQRTSSRGVRHFVHRSRSACSTAPESWQHVLTKSFVASVLGELDGEVDLEVEIQGVRADVLYKKHGLRPLAVEVQWSAQTLEEHQRRTEAYLARDVDVLWLYRYSHFRSRYWNTYPASHLIDVSDDGVVRLESGYDEVPTMSLEVVLCDIAYGVRWNSGGASLDEVASVPVAVSVTENWACWRCSKQLAVFGINGALPCCEDLVVGQSEMWSQSDLLKRAQERGKLPRPPAACSIEYRYTKTLGEKYWAHVCSHCDAVQGDWFLAEANLYPDEYESDVVMLDCKPSTVKEVLSELDVPGHWCSRS